MVIIVVVVVVAVVIIVAVVVVVVVVVVIVVVVVVVAVVHPLLQHNQTEWLVWESHHLLLTPKAFTNTDATHYIITHSGGHLHVANCHTSSLRYL